ncbi:hypothetical protein PTRA_a2940 [Pseudoalteromonas translucida KMM 520]|uniref:Uncharacterized protein n=1 Tax=Pseudoalteromonas translucida KMM 520 TaxID=1315283 RepID=A0A0U2WKV6_9GAMM|nr:hypothetical protein PTRA_a2940 [Pseudoalteromonas translucida KMM 520]
MREVAGVLLFLPQLLILISSKNITQWPAVCLLNEHKNITYSNGISSY